MGKRRLRAKKRVNEEYNNILILGIGNLLWADEGFGVRAVEAFQQKFETSDNITVMDGGTQGLYLVPYVQQCDVLVVFDAVDYGLKPGTIKIVKDDDVPAFMGAKKMSLHQTGFQEVLATSQLLGDYPKKIMLLGVQPVELDDYGGSLRDEVKAQIEPCLDIAKTFLEELGIQVTERAQPLTHTAGLSDDSLSLGSYEGQRPSAQEAYRQGDIRVLESNAFNFDPKIPDTNLSVNIDQRVQDPPPVVSIPPSSVKDN